MIITPGIRNSYFMKYKLPSSSPALPICHHIHPVFRHSCFTLLNSITFFPTATTKTCISSLFRPPQMPFALASKHLFSSHLLLCKIPLVQLCHLPFSPPEKSFTIASYYCWSSPLHLHPFPSPHCFAQHLSPLAMPRGQPRSCLPSHRTTPLPPHISPSAPLLLPSELQPSPWLQIYTWQILS